MKTSNAILALVLAAFAVTAVITSPTPSDTAIPDLANLVATRHLDTSDFPFRHPTPTAVRGPCPFLNTAANHGLLPRSGKHITLDNLSEALTFMGLPNGMKKLLVSGLKKGLAKKLGPDHPTDEFDLSVLNARGLFEHDLSLSRYDQVGDKVDQTPSAELVSGLLDLAYAHRYQDADGRESHLGYSDLSQWRRRRYEQETAAKTHTVRFGAGDQLLSAGECALLLEILGRKGEISASHARSFLLDQRFPEGWQPTRENGFTLTYRIASGSAKCGVGYYTPDGVLRYVADNKSDVDDNEAPDVDGAEAQLDTNKLFDYSRVDN